MKVLSVVETAIYVDDLDAAEDFYQRVLGLSVIPQATRSNSSPPASGDCPVDGSWLLA